MPRTSDASAFTRHVKAAATTIADPTKKSASFLAVTKDGFQSAVLKTSAVAAKATPSGVVLAIGKGKSNNGNRG